LSAEGEETAVWEKKQKSQTPGARRRASLWGGGGTRKEIGGIKVEGRKPGEIEKSGRAEDEGSLCRTS